MPLAGIKESVGKSCKNKPDDVRQVRKLLNHAIDRGFQFNTPRLNDTTTYDETLRKAIYNYQKFVVGLGMPDSKIGPSGATIGSLTADADLPGMHEAIHHAVRNAGLGPLAGIPGDLWTVALKSMIDHADDPRLTRRDLITLVDFRRSRNVKRIWIVDLEKRKIERHTWVAHGRGTDKKAQPDVPTKFSNDKGTNLSCVGAFVTRHSWPSSLGKDTNGRAMGLYGLDATNTNARWRGIHFHGATYVKPDKVGSSHGCFATQTTENKDIINRLEKGSFVYAYAGPHWNGSS